MKPVSQILLLFFAQIIIELIIMTLLAKAGIPYMDFDFSNEGITEMVLSIGYYYSFSKGIVVILPYILLMLIGDKVLKKISLIHLNSIISVLFTVSFWLIFGNPANELINPVLSSLLAALFIFLLQKLAVQHNRNNR